MKFNLIFCLILSVTVVYGSVSFRNVRSAQWQQQPRPYNGSATWGVQVEPRRHPTPGYNRTGTFGTTRVPQHLPGYRPPPTFNQTRTPGLHQITYNHSTTHISTTYPRSPDFNPYLNKGGRNVTTPRLYPDLSNRFVPGSSNTAPLQPYPATNIQPSYGNYNASRTNQPSYYPGASNIGRQSQQPNSGVNTYQAYGGGGAANTNYNPGATNTGGQPQYPNSGVNTYSGYGGGVAATTNYNPGAINTGGQPQYPNSGANTYSGYGGGVAATTNYNPGATNTGGQPQYPNSGANTYSGYGGGVAANTNYNPGATNTGGQPQQQNSGVSTWGHPNYRAPNVTQPGASNYYNPNVYA